MICKSTNKNIDLSFHVFPKSEKRKNESVRKVRGKDFVPKLNSYVCSAHFGFNCWTQNGSLKLSAIPTLATLTYQGNYTKGGGPCDTFSTKIFGLELWSLG